MAENRNYGYRPHNTNQNWHQNENDRQGQHNDNNQQTGYGDQLKGGYGGSEYGNTYYKADYNNYTNRRVNYMPDNDDNLDFGNRHGSSYTQPNRNQHQGNRGGYGNQGMNYGGGAYRGDSPGGYGRVGNTGGSFNDTGRQDDRYNYDRDRTYDNMGGNRERRGEDKDWWDRATDKVSSWFSDDDEHTRSSETRTRGEHRGKGPRGYQRSADRIREDICDRLSDDPFVDASDIEVKIEGNEVVLSGSVDSKEAKRRAEDLVESISGVRNVENRIRVDKDRDSNINTRYYTSANDVGDATGTTSEIIRDQNNLNRK